MTMPMPPLQRRNTENQLPEHETFRRRSLQGEDGGGQIRSNVMTTGLVMMIAFGAMVIGGSGAKSPIAETVAQLFVLSGLAMALVLSMRNAFFPSSFRDDTLVFGLLLTWLTIPIVQLIPVPPIVWQSLPGRAALVAALESVNAGHWWWPMSLTPYRTITAFLSMLPMAVVIFLMASLPVQQRSLLLMPIVAVALVSALIGIVQVVSGGPWVYPRPRGDFAVGLIANRNAHADFLLIALLALSTMARIYANLLRSLLSRLMVVALACCLALTVVLTGSRSGMLLLVIPMLHGAWLFRDWLFEPQRRWSTIVAGPIIAIIGLACIATLDGGNIARSIDRFGQTSDGRLTSLWPDARYAAHQTWPIGSGMGSFRPVFESAERLEVVDDSYPNQAHMDYLELLMEAGLVGAILLAATFGAFVFRCRTMLSAPAPANQRWAAGFSLTAGAVLALHSLVDYPLRTISLTVAAAIAIGLVLAPTRGIDRNFRAGE